MGLFLKRASSIVVAVAFAVVGGARLALDLIGWSTAPDDVGVAMNRLDQILLWILSIPAWLVFSAVLLSSMWLMWVSWPRSQQATDERRSGKSDDRLIQAGLDAERSAGELDGYLSQPPDARPNPLRTRTEARALLREIKALGITVPTVETMKSFDAEAKWLRRYFYTVGPLLRRGLLGDAKIAAQEVITEINEAARQRLQSPQSIEAETPQKSRPD